jgi:hypothetical protein
MFSTGEHPGNFYWPKLFPFLGVVMSYLGVSVHFSLQLISLLSILGALYFLQRILQLLYNTSGTWFVLLAAATQVYFVRSALFVMSDALATFWLMGFLFFYLKLRGSKELKFFLLLLVCAVAAVFTRYAAMPLLVIPLIHAFWMVISKWNVFVRIILIAVFGSIAVFVLLFNNQTLDLVSNMFATWDFGNLFRRQFIYDSYPQSYWVPNGMYVWSNFAHVGFLSCGVLLVLWWRRWNFQLKWVWLGVIGYLIFLGGIGFQNQRFMVISHLWVLVLLFPAFVFLQNWLKQRKIWWPFVVSVLLFNSAFFYFSFSKLFAMHQLEKEISVAVNQLEDTPKIYTFYMTSALGSYDVPNQRIDLWEEHLEFEKGSYVLFNVQQFGTTKRVMRNWKQLNREFDLKIIDELPENWNIYRIQ